MLVASLLPQIFLLFDFHSSYKHILFYFWAKPQGFVEFMSQKLGKIKLWTKKEDLKWRKGPDCRTCMLHNYVIFRPRTTSLQLSKRLTTLPQCHCSCFSHGSWTHSLTLSCYCITNTFPPPLFNDLWKQLINIGSKRTTNLQGGFFLHWYPSKSSKCQNT